MDFAETEEQVMLREAVARLAADFGHGYWVDCVRRGAKTSELWAALSEAGFVGVAVDERYGGGGRGISELAIVTEEVAAAGCPLLLLIVSPAICASIIGRFGDEDQRQRWMPGFASGTPKMAFAITEPDAGSNSHNIAVRAERDGDTWRIRGTKYYISGCDEAEALLVVTRTGTDPDTGRARLSLFVVDLDAPGLELTPIPMEITAPEKQFTVFFDDVDVGADRLVGTEHDGLRQVFAGLNPERITGAAVSSGIARFALGRAAEYARQRQVWGVPIGSHQGIAHPLARAKIDVELARLMTQKAAWAYDAGLEAAEAANMAKFAAAEAGLAALDQAIQTHGGNGLSSEFGLADLWGMARLLRTAPISREMILNFVAQHSLGLPKSY